MSNRLDYAKASPEGYKAFGGVYVYLQNSGLSHELIDLVYLRVSQINGCAYCIDMHSRDLVKLGVTVEKLVLVPVWRDAGDVFSTRERIALSWAETVTRVAEGHTGYGAQLDIREPRVPQGVGRWVVSETRGLSSPRPAAGQSHRPK